MVEKIDTASVFSLLVVFGLSVRLQYGSTRHSTIVGCAKYRIETKNERRSIAPEARENNSPKSQGED